MIWRLKKAAERRFGRGHPWVYSNDLNHSPKGVQPGEWVELRDSSDRILGVGLASAHSLIAWREFVRGAALPKTDDDLNQWIERIIDERMRAALALRERTHSGLSFRLVHAEADRIPGVIVDAFVTLPNQEMIDPDGGWSEVNWGVERLFVLRSQSGAGDRLLPHVARWLQKQFGGRPGCCVIRRDSAARTREGIEVFEDPKVFAWGVSEALVQRILKRVKFILRKDSVSGDFVLESNLWNGQKTGFFLDQAWNIDLLMGVLERGSAARSGEPLRVLDLFCFVGQWSARIVQREAGAQCVLVDSSREALELAERNVRRAGGKQVQSVRMDIVRDLPQWGGDGEFDVVLLDPPALIKARKDHEMGLKAYRKLIVEAMRLTRPGGLLVVSSCSYHLKEEELDEALALACVAKQRPCTMVLRGGHGPDHPLLPAFPEGRYLKMVLLVTGIPEC